MKLPVRFIDGHWELEYGGGVPVAPGTRGVLEVSEDAIADEEFRQSLTRAERLHVLDEGSELLFLLNVRASGLKRDSRPIGVLKRVPSRFFAGDTYVGGDSRVVSATLGPLTSLQVRQGQERGGLWMVVKGLSVDSLVSSQVLVPQEVSRAPLSSLNHAFTTLSEIFETHRISHTGSVYRRVFYLERDGFWHSLGTLRNSELMAAEESIAHELWQRVANRLPTLSNR